MTLQLGADSIFSGVGRVHALTRWLAERPEGAVYLVVTVTDRDSQSSDTLARWSPPADLEPGEWATRIEGLIRDYAAEMRGTVHAKVRWLDEAGTELATKRLRATSERDGEPAYEGTSPELMSLLMQHQQALMESFTNGMQYSVVEAGRRSQEAYRKLVDLEAENRELRDELAGLKAEQVEQTAAQVITENQDPITQRFEKLMEIAIMQWMQRQNQAKLPPTPTTPTE